MSENDKIPEYSADYRGSHPKPPPRESAPGPRPAPAKPAAGAVKPAARKAPGPAKTLPEKRSAPVPPRLGNGTEIDDFLPDGDEADGENLLTKWDDGVSETRAAPRERSLRKTGKYRWGLAAGAAVLLLALAGVVILAVQAGKSIHAAATDDSKLRAYDRFLSVVVAQDPKPFDSPEKADPDFVLNASLWKTMADNESSYTDYDDAGRTVVPLGDVADACGRLFGPKCPLRPKNPATESFYTYDAAKAQFHIAPYSPEGAYEPYTVSAKKEGDGVVLRVGYLSPADPARSPSSGAGSSSAAGGPAPVKYMEYVVRTDGSTGQDYVYAVREAP